MTDIQFQMIVKILSAGAPAIANELCVAVAEVMDENAALKAKIAEFEFESVKASEPESNEVGEA